MDDPDTGPTLVVAGSLEDAAATADALVAAGVAATGVGGRAAAVDRVQAEPVRAVVAEHDPDLDGLALVRAVRDVRPDLPVVLFPVDGDEELAGRAVDAGVDGYVPRSAGVEALAERVAALVADGPEPPAAEPDRDRLRELVEHTSDLILVIDDGGVIRYQSPAATRLLGYEPDELVGEHALQFVHPADHDRATETFEAIRTGEGWDTWEVEHRVRDADGDWRWFRSVGANRPDSSIEGYVVTGIDITAHRDRERRLTAVHEAAYDLAAASGEDAVFEILMEAAEAVLDIDLAVADLAEDGVLVPKAVSSGMASEDYHDETPIDASDSVGARAYRTGETVHIEDLREVVADPADATFRSGITVPIGEFGVFQAVSREVGGYDESTVELLELLVEHARAALARLARTRELRERRERLVRENERLDEFASVVSHDLRNPLNVAQGRLDLVRGRVDDEDLERADDALGRMETLIADLLTLARSGEVVDEVEAVDLAALAREAWGSLSSGDGELSVEYRGRVLADRGRLRQLLENLLSNAVDHGGPGVSVVVGALDDGFYVADDGPGVPADRREDVFEAGYTTSDAGTGFGLRIVADIAQAHGWSVELSAAEDGGAHVSVRGVESA